MKLWIARDKDGEVNLFQEKPFIIGKSFHSGGFWMRFKQTNNNRTFLKHITFENSPQQVKIELVSEIIGTTQSPSKTFSRVNEFEVGASYRR